MPPGPREFSELEGFKWQSQPEFCTHPCPRQGRQEDLIQASLVLEVVGWGREEQGWRVQGYAG